MAAIRPLAAPTPPVRELRGLTPDALVAEMVATLSVPGDVLTFRNTVVHRSGFNPSPRRRDSIQIRFGGLRAEAVVARGWTHRSADGFDTFAQLRPELIAFKEDQ
jgi:hypothetical protein